MPTIATANAATKAEIRALMRGPNSIVVGGSQGDYSTVDAALAAITDAADDNRYTVVCQAGELAPFTMIPYVDVYGSGRGTIIPCDVSSAIQVAGYATLANMRILFDDAVNGAGTAQGAIEKVSSAINALKLKDLEIEVLSVAGAPGDRYGINWQANTVNAILDNVDIISRGGGIYYSSAGNITANGSNIWLIGEDDDSETGTNRYGLIVPGAARATWHGGRITCGYNGFPQQNPNESTKDVIPVFIPQANTNSSMRIDLFGVWCYAHNRASTIAGKLNTTRAENGWIRRFGCIEQAENPNTTPSWDALASYGAYNTADDPRYTGPSAGIGGLNQQYGGHASGFEGNVGGQLVTLDGVSPASPELHEYTEGVVCLDATSGAFTVDLSTAQASVGQHFIGAHIAGDEAVTLDAQGSRVILPRGTSSIDIRPRETFHLKKIDADTFVELTDRPVLAQGIVTTPVAMTGSDVTLETIAIPGGIPGKEGSIVLEFLAEYAVTGGPLYIKSGYNGNNFASTQGWGTANTCGRKVFEIANMGAENAQLALDGSDQGSGEASAGTGTVNTANDYNLTIKANAPGGQITRYKYRVLMKL